MATQRWTGNGANVKQVVTVAVTAFDVATTYKITMNSKVVSVLGLATNALTAAALQVALAASEDPEFQEVDWTVSSATITGTANTAGTPFTASSSVSGGAGTIGAVTTATANQSKNDAANTANWSGGALPGTGDSAVFDDGGVDCLWNLLTFASAADLTAVLVKDTYRGRISLPTYNDAGIYELSYRGGVFTAQTITSLTVEQSSAAGPGWYKFNTGATACTLLIKGPPSTGLTPGDEVVWCKGAHASNIATLEGGSLLSAPLAGETATCATLRMVNAGATMTSGVTLTTANVTNSTLLLLCNGVTVNIDGPQSIVRAENAVTMTTVVPKEGLYVHNSSGTITTLGPIDGAVDFSGDRRAKTVTNAITMRRASRLSDPNAVVTYTAGFVLSGCRLSEVTLDVGPGRTLTVA